MSSDSGFALEREQLVPGQATELFEFFENPENLTVLTPPQLQFRVIESSTPVISQGTVTDYAFKFCGFPLKWTSLISMWNPPFEFVDEQVRGPYRSWVHQHAFEQTDAGVRIRDRVTYRVLGGALVNGLFVRRELNRIFDYRKESLAKALLGRY